MISMHKFYLDRAADAGRSAAGASLANVRERHLLAEITWNGLAARAGRVDVMQARLAAEAAQPSLQHPPARQPSLQELG